MTKTHSPLTGGWAITFVSFGVMSGVIAWRVALSRLPPRQLPAESSQRVKEMFPLLAEEAGEGTVSDMADALFEANPFSPSRRRGAKAKPQDDSVENLSAEGVAHKPQFVYKGRVQLGAKQRAVLEETTVGKTYFLQVGQEVTGFKVLDIDEKQVLLSNLKTHEEVVVLLTSKTPP